MTELRDRTIHPFTDLLLHDMGPGLADNRGGEARLDDGRARPLGEAILWHGGEVEMAKQAIVAMSAAERAALVKLLKSL